MNIQPVEDAQSDLSQRLVSAIKDPQKWGDVLECIITITGAQAAIITLRHKDTCQIVNDVELEQKFHSPLVRGFSNEAIAYYLNTLRTIDPWAACQKQKYPYLPMQMSTVLSKDSIADSRFFDWLESEKIDDTIVFELDRMAGYWTAINLFTAKDDDASAENLMLFAKKNYSLIRSAWQTSQEMARYRQANHALFKQASAGGAPVCIAGPNGEMLTCNTRFRQLIDRDVIRLSGNDMKLSFSESVSVHGLQRWEQHNLTRHRGDETDEILVLAYPFDPDPFFANKREQNWLITCSGSEKCEIAPAIMASFNLDRLNDQEKSMYELVASGKPVTDAGSNIGLKRSRSFQVWASVKQKLGIASSHQLR